MEIAKAEARLEDITETVNNIDKSIEGLVTQRKALTAEKGISYYIASLSKNVGRIVDFTRLFVWI